MFMMIAALSVGSDHWKAMRYTLRGRGPVTMVFRRHSGDHPDLGVPFQGTVPLEASQPRPVTADWSPIEWG